MPVPDAPNQLNMNKTHTHASPGATTSTINGWEGPTGRDKGSNRAQCHLQVHRGQPRTQDSHDKSHTFCQRQVFRHSMHALRVQVLFILDTKPLRSLQTSLTCSPFNARPCDSYTAHSKRSKKDDFAAVKQEAHDISCSIASSTRESDLDPDLELLHGS